MVFVTYDGLTAAADTAATAMSPETMSVLSISRNVGCLHRIIQMTASAIGAVGCGADSVRSSLGDTVTASKHLQSPRRAPPKDHKPNQA